MTLVNIFTKLLYLLVICYIFTGVPQARGTNSDIKTKSGAVIELAIFCDEQFSKMFRGDSNKMAKYWGALVWDAHLKFQGIHGANISFRVNSITVLKDFEERKIAKYVRSADGTSLGEKLLDSFSNWLYDEATGFVAYDVAVLAIGSTVTGESELARALGGVFSMDTVSGHVKSSFVINMGESQLGKSFTRELAHVMNAPHDDEEDYEVHDCGEYNPLMHNFVMGFSGWHGLQQRLFSPCSQRKIVEFLQSEKSSCFKHVHNVDSIVNTLEPQHWDIYFGAVSMTKQCQIQAGSDAAYVDDETECANIACHVALAPGEFPKTILFEAFEGTPCKYGNFEGHCSFGKCEALGGLLRNTASGKCFQNDNPFVWNEVAALSGCNTGTPLNALVLEEVGGGTENVQIRALDFSDPDFEFTSKCLTISKNANAVTFEKCEPESNSPEFVWEMRFIYNGESVEYLLAHRQSNKCLTYLNNSTALMSLSYCSEKNTKQRWSLVKYGDRLHIFDCHNKKGWKYCFGNSTFRDQNILTIIASFIASTGIVLSSLATCGYCLRFVRNRRAYHLHNRRNNIR